MTKRITVHVVLVVAWLTLGIGCSGQKEGANPAASQTAGGFFPHVQKTGGQIWAENCSRCHIPRPSTQYSAQQWDLITTHMRLRCDLNGEEQRAVYHFMSGQ